MTVRPEVVPLSLIGTSKRSRPSILGSKLQKWHAGALHVHTVESTLAGYGHFEALMEPDELAPYGQRIGLEFIGISDHASHPGKPERLPDDATIVKSLRWMHEAATITNEQMCDVFCPLLVGVEANIFFDTKSRPVLDFVPDSNGKTVMDEIDFVIASRHKIDREKEPQAISESLRMAVREPLVDILGHPDRYTRRDGKQPQEYWKEYWGIWPDILDTMAARKVAFEINLNSQPSRDLVKMAVARGVLFSISYDFHEFLQWKPTPAGFDDIQSLLAKWAVNQWTKRDLNRIYEYKIQQLCQGPGIKAIRRLNFWVNYLEECGVTPDRIVNSSLKRFILFLAERDRKTENIALIAERAGIHL